MGSLKQELQCRYLRTQSILMFLHPRRIPGILRALYEGVL
jgi:hypothetical protein